MWDYNWDEQGSGVIQEAFSGEQIQHAIEHHKSLQSEWKEIVRARRPMMNEGFYYRFKDLEPGDACSMSNCFCSGLRRR